MGDPLEELAPSSALAASEEHLPADQFVREPLTTSPTPADTGQVPADQSLPETLSALPVSHASDGQLLPGQPIDEPLAACPVPVEPEHPPADHSIPETVAAPASAASEEHLPANRPIPDLMPPSAAAGFEELPPAIPPILVADSGETSHPDAGQPVTIPDKVRDEMYRRKRRSARLVKIAIVAAIVGFCGRWTPAALIWIPALCVPIFLYALARCFFLHSQVRRDRRRISAAPLRAIPDKAVLYLRSFSDDHAASKLCGALTEEEHLTKALGQIGSVIAVGRPNEFRPELGARRMYRSDEEWQSAVENAIRNAVLVVMRTGSSAGILWELDRVVRYVAPQKLLLIVDDVEEMKLFLSTIRRAYPHVYPSVKLRGPKIGSVRGFLQFDDSWQVSSIRLRRCFFSKNQDSSMIGIRFRCSLRPLFQRLGLPWKRPKIDWIKVMLKAPLALFVATAVVEAFVFLLFGAIRLLCRW